MINPITHVKSHLTLLSTTVATLVDVVNKILIASGDESIIYYKPAKITPMDAVKAVFGKPNELCQTLRTLRAIVDFIDIEVVFLMEHKSKHQIKESK